MILFSVHHQLPYQVGGDGTLVIFFVPVGPEAGTVEPLHPVVGAYPDIPVIILHHGAYLIRDQSRIGGVVGEIIFFFRQLPRSAAEQGQEAEQQTKMAWQRADFVILKITLVCRNGERKGMN